MSAKSEMRPRYRRVILKLSGESFCQADERGISMDEVVHIARQIQQAKELGCRIAVVIGGGNILRGAQFKERSAGIQEATAHYMGMLATVINGLALQDALESLGCETRLMSAIRMDGVAEPYIRRRAIRHLEKGRVVIFSAGTGNPFMTTDTASALRALEIGAEILLMAKNGVDGVYDSDPRENSNAQRFGQLDYMDALSRRLQVMDSTAVSLCMDNKLPIVVFDIFETGNISRILVGEEVGTIITGRE